MSKKPDLELRFNANLGVALKGTRPDSSDGTWRGLVVYGRRPPSNGCAARRHFTVASEFLDADGHCVPEGDRSPVAVRLSFHETWEDDLPGNHRHRGAIVLSAKKIDSLGEDFVLQLQYRIRRHPLRHPMELRRRRVRWLIPVRKPRGDIKLVDARTEGQQMLAERVRLEAAWHTEGPAAFWAVGRKLERVGVIFVGHPDEPVPYFLTHSQLTADMDFLAQAIFGMSLPVRKARYRLRNPLRRPHTNRKQQQTRRPTPPFSICPQGAHRLKRLRCCARCTSQVVHSSVPVIKQGWRTSRTMARVSASTLTASVSVDI